MKNKKYLYLLLLIVPIIVFFIGNAYSQEVEVKSIEIQSEDYPEPGSWHITKSAEWIDANKARVTFDVDSVMKTEDEKYKDIILVIDISSSMEGEKLDRAKSDSIELTEYLLSDTHNSMALIVFNSGSEIETGFINDKDEMLRLLNDLIDKDCTNYNSALKNVDIIMQNYVQKDDTDLVTLFLTDGYPNEDTPNQIATYQLLKEKYPYMTINGIQYEMGKDIIQEIIDITDNQWVADQDTLHNVLFDATVTPLVYESFVITDYINNDFFDVNSSDDIDVSIGTATYTIENGINKIEWNLDDKYKTGENAKMTIDISLKSTYVGQNGLYSTNKNEHINSKLFNEDEKQVTSELTPILKNIHSVYYDNNTPSGCSLPTITSEEYSIFLQVNKNKGNLFCKGYSFKGWMIDDNDKNDIKMINDDIFLMPGHDVHIKAIWTKQALNKSMDGTVHEKETLYMAFQREVENGYAELYTRAHQDAYDNSGTSNIYYFHAINTTDANKILEEKDNVIFAEHCWQMYRTTDTGGVKLIYNGEPENGKCLQNRNNHVGYGSKTIRVLVGSYYYGTDYTFDKQSKKFKLAGTINSYEVTNSNLSSMLPLLKGQYTCMVTNPNYSCSTLYLIDNYENNTVITLNANSNYSQYGKMEFNYNADSPSYVGYMHNDFYSVSAQNQKDNILQNNNQLVIGDNYIDNHNGTYTIINNDGSSPTIITNNEWYTSNQTDRNKYKNKYLCNGSSATCSNLKHISSVSYNYYNYWSPYYPYKYSETVSYENGIYTLTGDIQTIWDIADDIEREKINTHHYTCKNSSTICSPIVYYVNYITPSDKGVHYAQLNNVENVNDAVTNMISVYTNEKKVNTKDSTIKIGLDAWYKKFILNKYDSFIEDTIYCNDRKISSIGGWSENGDSSKFLQFGQTFTNIISCPNETDRFSTLNDKAKLDYKIGLATNTEMTLLGNSQLIKSGQQYWLSGASGFDGGKAKEFYINASGYINSNFVNTSIGVRPVISLKHDVEYIDGDGSMEHPYLIDDGTH